MDQKCLADTKRTIHIRKRGWKEEQHPHTHKRDSTEGKGTEEEEMVQWELKKGMREDFKV